MGSGASTLDPQVLKTSKEEDILATFQELPEDKKSVIRGALSSCRQATDTQKATDEQPAKEVAAADEGPAKDLSKAFACFDTSGDGFLDVDELKRAFRAIGFKKVEVTNDIFKSFDANGDGKISLEEFNANLHPKTRKMLEAKLDAGFSFDPAKWAESAPTVDLSKAFICFDTSGDGFLDIDEMKRAFRAVGFKKVEVTNDIFASFDTNGDGKVSLEEFEANLHPKTRKMLEAKLDNGFNFDPAKWAESAPTVDLTKAFQCFDTSGDGFLDISELKRAFRAIGFKKVEVTDEIFQSFDKNGDGKISLKEFDEGMHPKTRKMLEAKLDNGFSFDPAKWAESAE